MTWACGSTGTTTTSATTRTRYVTPNGEASNWLPMGNVQCQFLTKNVCDARVVILPAKDNRDRCKLRTYIHKMVLL